MNCKICGAPASPGTFYRCSYGSYEGQDYQCGLPCGSPEDACGQTFRVWLSGCEDCSRYTLDDDWREDYPPCEAR